MSSYLDTVDSIVLWYRTYAQMRHPAEDDVEDMLIEDILIKDSSLCASDEPDGGDVL